MTTIYVIRHAEKEWGNHYNPKLRHQDEPITARGRQMAEKLCDFFSQVNISAIYISGYLRTAQTAAPLAQERGSTPIIDERLNEFDNGCIEGMSDEEIQAKYPDVWSGYQERNADFRFPEGETGEEVRRRIAGFLEEKLNQPPNGSLVIFSHDGLIRTLMCHVLGLPVYHRWDFKVDFCGILELKYLHEQKRWKLIRWNQIYPSRGLLQ